MKVIFVASGNKRVGGVSAFVRSQFESLREEGLEMVLFPVRGKGWRSYARAVGQLRKVVRSEHADIVHAHYSVCGVVAWLATLGSRARVVVSILGSFPHKNFKLKWVRFCIKHLWDATIVKSQRTADQLGMALPVVPNGVNLSQFAIMPQDEARRACGFLPDKRYVIWCSDPSRVEKRFEWAQEAVDLLKDEGVCLYPVYNKPHDEMVKYFCAADVMLLTSESEGSPNVVKEAMACNCPVVSTDVGDVKWITHEVEGTYVAPCGDTRALALSLAQALQRGGRTSGRERIEEYGITTECIARKIIDIYESV